MGVKKYNPLTPSLRTRVTNAFTEVTASTPEKSLTTSIKQSGGRNHDGKMTVRNIGGRIKRTYRIIDFKRDKDGVPAVVENGVQKSKAVAEVTLNYGAFIQTIFDFVIIGFCIFIVLKAYEKAQQKIKKEDEPKVTTGPTQEQLLAEIRDLLKNK
ncbi:MAG: large-conductance mechanosensitive channel protein MscL [Bacteroidota bacterium]